MNGFRFRLALTFAVLVVVALGAVRSVIHAQQTSEPILTAPSSPGDLDTSFGQGGTTTVSIPGTSTAESGNAVALQSDGKAVIVGSAQSNIAIMRLNTDGSLDTTFGFGGKVASNVGYEGDAVAIQADGKIVVGGLAGAGP